MGDPLSVAASVAGLVSLGLQTTEYLYKYYVEYRDRDQDLARKADRLGDLLQSLRIVDKILRTSTRRPDEQIVLQNVKNSITRCEDIIHDLQDEVGKFQDSAGSKKKLRTVGFVLRWKKESFETVLHCSGKRSARNLNEYVSAMHCILTLE